MLPVIEEGTSRKNLRLHAKSGKVSARVDVRANPIPTSAHSSDSSHSSSGDGQAHINFRSDTSNIKVRLRRTEVPRLNVFCYTPVGSVTIYLPHDFQGPIRTTTTTGVTTLYFSPAVAKQCTPLLSGSANSLHSRRCVNFLGRCPGPYETWDQYDELEIDARRGYAKILFVDEQDQTSVQASVKQVVMNVQNEGMVNYLGRVVTSSLEKSRERLALRHAASFSNLSTIASRNSGKIT